MRIAFVTTVECPWGGSEELWSQAALRLRRRGHDVLVSAQYFARLDPRLARLEEAGCSLRLRSIRRPRRLFARTAYRWLDAARPDLVVISVAAHHHGGDWMRECRARDVRYAVVVQSCDESYFPHDEQADLLRGGYVHARRVFFVSRNNYEFLRRSIAVGPLDHRIIRNPFNVRYDAAPPWPPPGPPYRLACVARLEPVSKGQDLLFEVLAARKWRERPLRVTLYGTGLSTRVLARLRDELDLTAVAFGGFLPDVEDVWRLNHALILPSRFEGLPLALVEAMLCQRLCIVTGVSGNPELIDDGVSGVIARAATSPFIDEAMERAWEARDEWERMGQVAGRRVREQVPRDPIASFVEEVEALL